MKVAIPDEDVRAFLQVGKKVNLGEAIMDHLYRDPRFDQAREAQLGQWLVRTLVANIRAGHDVSGGYGEGGV